MTTSVVKPLATVCPSSIPDIALLNTVTVLIGNYSVTTVSYAIYTVPFKLFVLIVF